MSFEIIDLADAPELSDACAAWAFGLWGSQAGGSLPKSQEDFERASRRGDPDCLTFVARREGMAIGMVSLRETDFEGRPDLSPWMASVYVHPEHRRSGVASRLIRTLEEAARGKGHDRLYLITEHAERLYASLGWTTFDKVVGPHGPAVLMSKALEQD